ncbi:MAG: hypothetical protein ACRDTC_17745 [Pseudonocardiaceae bacterium]
MATTNDNTTAVTIDKVDVWFNPESAEIHITTRDPDAAKFLQHTTISNKPDSVRYHRTFYRDLARLLVAQGKDVPGWTVDGPTE